MSHSYRDLIVWQKAVDTVTMVYKGTRCFPREETYGLTSQLRRSAVSVACNIAEGQGRLSKKDFRHFLAQARGSLLEMETQIQIAHNLGYFDLKTANSLTDRTGEVGRLLHRLIQSLAPSLDPTEN